VPPPRQRRPARTRKPPAARSDGAGPPQRIDRRTREARRDPVSSRERLLRAAAAVFAERGFDRASVDDIAAEAGVSKGTLYWHFEGKDELFLALLEEQLGRSVESVLSLLQTAPPETDVAPQASDWFTSFVRDQRELVLLSHEYWTRAARDPQLRTIYAQRQAGLRDAVAKALDARAEQLGAPAFDLPTSEVATAYIALYEGLSFWKLIDPDAIPDRLYGEIVGLVFQGLVARAENRTFPQA
jgi:AcrR family transcriptional regulator